MDDDKKYPYTAESLAFKQQVENSEKKQDVASDIILGVTFPLYGICKLVSKLTGKKE